MERKDYLERILDFKNDILREIRDILGYDTVHYFAETFFVHYIDEKVATTDVCTSVEVDKDGSVVFHVRPEGAGTETEMIADESVFQYEPESFMDILFNLKKEIREEKLSELCELVKSAGTFIQFKDDYFTFTGNGPIAKLENCELEELSLVNGELKVGFYWGGKSYLNPEYILPLEKIDELISYVKSKTEKKKFSIRVSGSWSREYEIEAVSYEEALAEAQEDFEINPICYADSNGEDWERIS